METSPVILRVLFPCSQRFHFDNCTPSGREAPPHKGPRDFHLLWVDTREKICGIKLILYIRLSSNMINMSIQNTFQSYIDLFTAHIVLLTAY